MAKDALAVLDHLGWKGSRSVHLCGLSMGGMITQELALLDTQRFASMTLVSTSPGGLEALRLYATNLPRGLKLLASIFAAKSPRAQLDYGLQVLYPKSFLEKKVNDPRKGTETTNYRVYRRALITRGMAAIEEGLPRCDPARRLSKLSRWRRIVFPLTAFDDCRRTFGALFS